MSKLYLRNIKKGYATNSSSYHTAVILTDEEYEKWLKDEFEIVGRLKSEFDNYDEDGMFYYIEDSTERVINGVKVYAFSIYSGDE